METNRRAGYEEGRARLAPSGQAGSLRVGDAHQIPSAPKWEWKSGWKHLSREPNQTVCPSTSVSLQARAGLAF